MREFTVVVAIVVVVGVVVGRRIRQGIQRRRAGKALRNLLEDLLAALMDKGRKWYGEQIDRGMKLRSDGWVLIVRHSSPGFENRPRLEVFCGYVTVPQYTMAFPGYAKGPEHSLGCEIVDWADTRASRAFHQYVLDRRV
jgi:hypothetical protein